MKRLLGQQKARNKGEPQSIDASNAGFNLDDVSRHTITVLKKLHQAHFEAHLVGGGVRDLLLRLAPKDFDVATNAKPEEIRKLFRNCRLIGRRFRLAHILFGREIIEVATFRGHHSDDSSLLQFSEDGLATRDNIYGTLEEDAWRRDFSINAIYYNYADNTLVDYTNGLDDLHTKTLRIIGVPEERYRTDPVRMLRAVRFGAKLGFTLEEETKKAIFSHSDLIELVPPARILGEITKLFHAGYALKTLHLLQEYDLFNKLFPQTAKLLDSDNRKNIKELLSKTCANTDKRIKANKPVTPAFLYAVFLWHPFLKELDAFEDKNLPFITKVELAMQHVIKRQLEICALPKTMSRFIKEVWILQYRLPKRFGQKPYRLLSHPRFRAAYDFLLLRAEIGEVEQELATWWTDFQEANETTRQNMLTKKPKRKRKKKTPPKKDET